MSDSHTTTAACPICDRQIKKRRKRRLYDTSVCRKCSYSLTRRRQHACFADIVLASLLWIVFISTIRFLDSAHFGTATPWLMGPAASFRAALASPFALIFVMTFMFKDGFHGHSPGKWLCGIQVVGAATMEPIGFRASFKRNMPFFLVSVIFFVGVSLESWLTFITIVGPLVFLLILTHQSQLGQRWGDRWAGTKVIWKKYRHRIPFDVRGVLCIQCGYDLQGNLSGVCPECGTAVASAQPLHDNAPQAPPGT